MATQPVDRNEKIMSRDFGTKCLITDPVADRYLERASRNNPDQKKFKEFCGGKNGWNDFTERWH
jgi:hypothetical protein